jgi:hypothetical protein
MDPEKGISMEVLTNYLQWISTSFNSFLDKLIEIETNDGYLMSDVGYLDEIELCFVDRILDEQFIRDYGKGIERTIYMAGLSEIVKKLNSFIGDSKTGNWEDKIESLKIIVVKQNIECKQMFYMLKRFEYFAQELAETYTKIVEPDYDFSLFEPEFNFWDLCVDADSLTDINKRRELFVNAKIKALKWLIEECINESSRSRCNEFVERCQQSIELIDYEISQMVSVSNGNILHRAVKTDFNAYSIKPAPKKKTDIIKILSAMYDANMFAGEDGKLLTNKQKMMEAFGEFLGDDFSSYSTSLSQAKTRDEKTFLKPFREIEKESLRYFNEVGK